MADSKLERSRAGPCVQRDFLELLERGRRGRLRVHLGLGVESGKTTSVLRDARAFRARGIDVVCAAVETRGRAGPEELLAGLERVPVRQTSYRGMTAQDVDVAGVLERRPAIAVVDDVHQSNTPGSPNAKRWLDVLQLLRGGVSVLAALDVRSLFSLNAAVHRATGVRIYETVPDAFLDEADQLVLVEPSEPARAAGDPIADLGRRVAAAFAGRSAAAVSPIPRVPRRPVAVALFPGDPSAGRLLERGAALAARLERAWFAVLLDPYDSSGPGTAQFEQARRTAEGLGAEIVSLPGAAGPALVEFVRRRGVGDLFVARPWPTGRPDPARHAPLLELLEALDDVDVHLAARAPEGP